MLHPALLFSLLAFRAFNVVGGAMLLADADADFAKEPENFTVYKVGSDDLILTPQQKVALKTRSTYLNVTKWSNGVVPYIIDDGIKNDRLYNKVLNYVFEHYKTETCVRLIPRTTESNYINFVDGGSCSSHFGQIGGKQDISLGRTCVMYNYGTAMHEIMHSLGFMHEQQRPDRDYFVNILYQNIPKSAQDQFEKVPYKDTDLLNSYYDFESLMHYPRQAFVSDMKTNSVEPKDSKYLNVIGQREYFSKCDIAKINRLYKCGGSYVTSC